MTQFKFLGFALVVLQAAFLISCGQKDNSSGRCDTSRNPTGCGGGSNTIATQNNTDISLQGIFTGDDQSVFQTAAQGLVSGTIAPTSLGSVNDGMNAPDNTGIAFGAKVSLTAGRFTANMTSTGQVATTSRLLVGVYDNLVGTQGSNGQTIGPVEIALSTASGSVANGSANITFSDSFGNINFQGTYDATTFRGTVTYDNTTVVGGGGEAKGSFQFNIPTCSFFVCN